MLMKEVSFTLLACGSSANMSADDTDKTVLHHAAMHGHLSVVKLLIDNHTLLDPFGELFSSSVLREHR
jgi:ankyrin repeat protein